ncbi:Xaa-Pro aminopeptidase [Rhizobiales bacterium GAS113]|nr:Xaa-Pro aminopeptidase [Rhizobiales bacterium GAS113]
MGKFIGCGHLDRPRAQSLMTAAGLEALLLVRPESIKYATGAEPGNATKGGRVGAAFVLVPADADQPPAAIIGDYYADAFHEASQISDLRTIQIWVDTADITRGVGTTVQEKLRSAAGPERSGRPATFDLGEGIRALQAILDSRNLGSARIGIEYGFVPHLDALALQHFLPSVAWTDATKLVGRLRAVKSPDEISILTGAAMAAETGMKAILGKLHPGATAQDLAVKWRAATVADARRQFPNAVIDTWFSGAIGSNAWGPGKSIQEGDLIKLDVGCMIDGYSSDSARTFVSGEASPDARVLFSAIEEAHAQALDALRFGAEFREIHQVAMRSMQRSGFETYRRGHFGHSLGSDLFVEEWPFFDSRETEMIEPGMVLAVEVPWYVRGLGAVMIEDQVTVTHDSVSSLWTLDRSLVSI